MLGLALLFALLLDSAPHARAAGFSRVSIFLPYAVPAVIASLLWGFLYLPGVSPFYYVFDKLGWDAPDDPVARPWCMFAIANIAPLGRRRLQHDRASTRRSRPIPTELYEAARLDGASEVQIAWRIKIPIVTPSLVMTFAVLDDRDAAGLRRADDAAAADQHHLDAPGPRS